MENYTIVKPLMNALYGTIYLGKDKTTHELVAVKQMTLSTMSTFRTKDNIQIAEDGKYERHVNQVLSQSSAHPNIVKLRNSFEENGSLYLILDYCSNGELFSKIEDAICHGRTLSEAHVRRYFQQILRGIGYMHECGFAHRDISLENILLNEQDECQICDFGLASTCAPTSQQVGKSTYMAPEVYLSELYEPKLADIWSLGIVLYVMLTGSPLVECASMKDKRFVYLKKHGLRKLVQQSQIHHLSAKALDLLEKMLIINPRKRIGIDQMLRDPWFCGHLNSRKRQGKYGFRSVKTFLRTRLLTSTA